MALDLSVCDTGEESLLNNACVSCSRSTDSLWNHLYSDVPSQCYSRFNCPLIARV